MIKSTLKWGLWALMTLFVILLGYRYWIHLHYYPSTDDAYVKANVVNLSANISGHVNALYVHDNQSVTKGTLLFTIDSRPYEIALKQAQAALDLTKQQIEAQKASVLIAKAKIKQAQAEYALNQKNAIRIHTLVKEGKASIASGDDIDAKVIASHQSVIAATNTYLQALNQLGDEGINNADLRRAKANVAKARLDLEYTQIRAPANGKLSQLTLRVGDIVHQGQTTFSMIEDNSFWIEANYKETQLSRIRPGQAVNISLDMDPSHQLSGVVDSISGSTGSSFSILPPENATGNWVKVTQRIPVRIRFDNPHIPLIALGASAYVSVDTTALN